MYKLFYYDYLLMILFKIVVTFFKFFFFFLRREVLRFYIQDLKIGTIIFCFLLPGVFFTSIFQNES